MLTLIVARAHGGAIGRDGDIPWHAPEDLKMFQRETSRGAMIMGRKTWESLPFKPLKNRLNIVVSRDASLTEHVVPSVEAALELAHEAGFNRIYGMGGEAIYRALLPMADRLMLTEVDLDVDKADAFFPEINEADWREVARRPLRAENPPCLLRELVRNSSKA